MDMDHYQKFKAIIDIDGNGWSSRFHKLLCMNSVVIKMQPGAIDYNMDYIQPWVHYIPAVPYGEPEDYNSSLPAIMEYINAKENEAAVQQIITNANRFCKDTLTHEAMEEDVLDIFAAYVEELDRYDSGWEKIWMQKTNASYEDILKYKIGRSHV